MRDAVGTYYIALVLAILLAGCSKPKAPAAISEKLGAVASLKNDLDRIETAKAFGCYAVDKGKLYRLVSEGRKKETDNLSPDVFVIFYYQRDGELRSAFLSDWRFLGDKPSGKLAVESRFIELPGRKSMVALMPEHPLSPSLYSACKRSDFDYQFGVQVANEKDFWVETLKTHPDSWQVRNHAGACYYMEKDFATALLHFKRAVELNPGNYEVQNNLGLALTATGDFEAALVHYAEAVRLDGESAIRTNYANCLAMAKRYAEAIVEYKIAVTLPARDLASIWFNLGNAYTLNSQIAEAAASYREVLKLQPNSQDAQKKLRYAEAQMLR